MSAELVIRARAWIGTPYHHQAACRGVGCDCLGLLRGLWREMRGAEPEPVPAYSPDWSEAAGEEALLAAAARHLIRKPRSDAAPGDVLIFRMRPGAVAKHVGIQAGTGAAASFVHAYSGHGVVESRLTPAWAGRIAARFDFPERTE